MPARVAPATYDLWLYRNLISYLESCYRGSDLNDITRDLVSLRYRISGERMLSMIDMDIASADSDHPDPYEDFIIGYRWNIYLAKRYFAWGRHDLLQHLSLHVMLLLGVYPSSG